MNAMRPFVGEARFLKSVCNVLIDSLDKRLTAIFRHNCPDYAVLHDLQASYQQSCFPDIIQAMQLAKDEVHSISAIARSSVGRQAFKLDVMTFASQDEHTLNHYSSGYTSDGATSGGDCLDGGYCLDKSIGYCLDGGYCLDKSTGYCKIGQRDSCFGYKGIHPWIKNSLVVCPNADQPGVRAAAQAA